MEIDRRNLLSATAVAGVALASTLPAEAAKRKTKAAGRSIRLSPEAADSTAALQRAIDRAAHLGVAIELAAGKYTIAGNLRLRPNTTLIGIPGLTALNLIGKGRVFASNATGISLTGINFTGGVITRTDRDAALLELDTCEDLHLELLLFESAPNHGLSLWQCSGRVHACRFHHIGYTAISSGNGRGLDISHNRIKHVGNNGVVIWRDAVGPDHTTVSNNHVSHVRTDAGGTGQNGNAINAFRAEHVIISANNINDCAYSAVRCNAASNAQIIANNCRSIGEVALYAEFEFQGAVIANNVVDGAASGISVTNFREGGRLATVQGNLIRNLFRREHEPVDKRGIGIGVEADTAVNGNTIENAPTAGISIGWGPWMRNVSATSNIVRGAGVGITVSASAKPKSVLIANNIIDQARNGAVRLTDHDRVFGKPLENEASNAPALLQGNLFS